MIKWPGEIITPLARRRAVLLIGSGVSANSTNIDGLRPPTWGNFLADAYAALGKRVPHIKSSLNRYAYLEACDYLKQELAAGWPNILRQKFSDPQYRPADIHKHLLNLDQRIVISLNFDRIYDTYAVGATEGTVSIKNYYDADIRESVCGQDRYILKPHGTIDSISKIIFTLNEYGEARVKYSRFYEIINSLLHTHTFICIGCGLSDPDMQILFEDYKYKFNETPHFILMNSPVSPEQKALIARTRGMTVLPYSPRDNHKELTESLAQLVDLVNDKRAELAVNQNW